MKLKNVKVGTRVVVKNGHFAGGCGDQAGVIEYFPGHYVHVLLDNGRGLLCLPHVLRRESKPEKSGELTLSADDVVEIFAGMYDAFWSADENTGEYFLHSYNEDGEKLGHAIDKLETLATAAGIEVRP